MSLRKAHSSSELVPKELVAASAAVDSTTKAIIIPLSTIRSGEPEHVPYFVRASRTPRALRRIAILFEILPSFNKLVRKMEINRQLPIRECADRKLFRFPSLGLSALACS